MILLLLFPLPSTEATSLYIVKASSCRTPRHPLIYSFPDRSILVLACGFTVIENLQKLNNNDNYNPRHENWYAKPHPLIVRH